MCYIEKKNLIAFYVNISKYYTDINISLIQILLKIVPKYIYILSYLIIIDHNLLYFTILYYISSNYIISYSYLIISICPCIFAYINMSMYICLHQYVHV